MDLPNYEVVLENVHFSYSGEEKDEVLHGINLKLPEGSFTALVGPSGGGKSTVAKLIARFWDVNKGAIKIGGRNIKELSLKQLSDTVSFVTQDNFLFNCSLKENIRLGDPSASDEEVYRAAKAACCDEFIAGLENGYDTSAGDAGKKLSGGEKQRIAIARAILKNAPVVILDEATAFTDPENEDKIQASVMAAHKGKNSARNRAQAFPRFRTRADRRIERRKNRGYGVASRTAKKMSFVPGYVAGSYRREKLGGIEKGGQMQNV